jgi:hypothetical protein
MVVVLRVEPAGLELLKSSRRIMDQMWSGLDPVQDLRDDVPCDLDEVFVRKNSERGRQRAQLWYWTEVASFSGRFLVERVRLAVGGRREGPGSTEGSIGGAMGGSMGSSMGERIADQLGAAPTVVLSHGFWVDAFASASDAIGQTLRLDDESYTVIGVMPAGFYFPDADVKLWTNFGDEAKERPRGWGDLSTIARLASGVSVEAARLDMSAVATRIAEANPDANNGDDARLTSRLSEVVGDMGTRLLLLAGAVALVQLIACANLANLLLVRATERSGESAVRTALGSTRWGLVRHVMLESMTLAVAGGSLGVLVATFLVSTASTYLPADIPRLGEIRLDASVLAFSLVLTLITGVVTGILPALRVGSAQLGATLREATSDLGAGRRKSWLQQGLVIAEISAAFALLIGSGVLLKSLVALTSVDRGFESEGVATLQVDLPEWSYPDDASLQDFLTSLVDRLEGIPGVTAAGATSAIPLADPGGYGPVVVQMDGGRESVDAALGVVTPGYFEALGIAVGAGRTFEPSDQRAELRVAVVSERFLFEVTALDAPVVVVSALVLAGTVAGQQYSRLASKQHRSGIGAEVGLSRPPSGASTATGVAARYTCSRALRDDVVDDVAGDISESEITTAVLVGELLVVDPHEVKDRGV